MNGAILTKRAGMAVGTLGLCMTTASCLAAGNEVGLGVVPGSPVEQKTRITDSLNSADVGAIARQQHRSFGAVMASPSLAAPSGADVGAGAASAKAGQYGSELRYGTHNVVSEDGQRVVWLIRLMTTSKGVERDRAAEQLKALSDRRVPEALNFMGFAAEHGAFGARPDIPRAIAFYRAAAAANYQPAIYNLALASVYGRGVPQDLGAASQLLEHAASVATDTSWRVCGMGAFVSDRRGDQVLARKFVQGCKSALATVPAERMQSNPLTPQRLEDLRKSTSTGIDDAYQMLVVATQHNAATDRQYNHCKYTLVARYRNALDAKTGALTQAMPELRTLAKRCVEGASADSGTGAPSLNAAWERDLAMAGIAAFVPAEVNALRRMREGNQFLYGTSVPYLPFAQQEVDLYKTVLAPASQQTSSLAAR